MPGLGDLPWHAHKCIAAKLVVHDALRREANLADVEGYGALFKAVRASVEGLADRALEDVSRSMTVPDFLRRLPDAVGGAVLPGEAEHKQRMAELLAEAVEEHLTAEDPVQRAFDGALGAARRLYERAGVPVEDEVGLWLWATNDAPAHSLPLQSHDVAGEVVERRGRRVVELTLGTKAFTWRAARAIPYVLFHELVVHALARRPPAGSGTMSAQFGEGWMDTIALQAHEAAVAGNAPLDGFEDAFDHPGATREAAGAMHAARYDEAAPGYGRRWIGREAANGLGTLLCAGTPGPCEALWSLSAALNRWKLDGVALDGVAAAVESALATGGGAREAVAEAAYAFLEDVDEGAAPERAAEKLGAAILSTWAG